MINVSIFASGTGSNAAKIIQHFKYHPDIRISLIVSSKATAGVLNIAESHSIPAITLKRDAFLNTDEYVNLLREKDIKFIVLAGFLWKVPDNLIEAFRDHIINIHPALLPKFGGKGMYGMFVHEAVKKAGEPVTGITIHKVDEHYDHGDVIFQAECPVEETDTPESIAKKVQMLEHTWFPVIVEKYISGLEKLNTSKNN
ncbi:MAG TPA: phosphoribosylglycinamide formyltransferase [Parasegetibacter sp.]